MRVAVTVVSFLAGLALSLYAYHVGQNNLPCMEDEIYAVQIDTNPAHGLTWACENVEEFVAKENSR